MRYRDCPTIEVEERIQADPARIWALLTDITLPTRFSDELQDVEWLDGANEVAVGNRFRGRNRNRDLGEWTTESVVVEVEPERRWVWEVQSDAGTMATWGFELDPGADAVRVRQWARMGPARSGLSIAIDAMPEKEGRIIAFRLGVWRTNIQANLVGIRMLLEAPC